MMTDFFFIAPNSNWDKQDLTSSQINYLKKKYVKQEENSFQQYGSALSRDSEAKRLAEYNKTNQKPKYRFSNYSNEWFIL